MNDWLPDPTREGWESRKERGVRMSRPVGPVVLSETSGPGIPLAMVMQPVELTIVDADEPFMEPCISGQAEHRFEPPFPCHDPTQLGYRCADCRKIRYVAANGEVHWGIPHDGGMTFIHRFPLSPPSDAS